MNGFAVLAGHYNVLPRENGEPVSPPYKRLKIYAMKFLTVTLYEICQLIIGLANLVIKVFRSNKDNNDDTGN